MLCPTPAPRLSISQRLNRFVYTFPHHTRTTINIMITLYARFHPKPARFKANQCLRISTHRRSNASEFAAPSKDSHWRGRSQVAGARRNTWAEDAPELVRPLCLRDPTILDAESRCRTPQPSFVLHSTGSSCGAVGMERPPCEKRDFAAATILVGSW